MRAPFSYQRILTEIGLPDQVQCMAALKQIKESQQCHKNPSEAQYPAMLGQIRSKDDQENIKRDDNKLHQCDCCEKGCLKHSLKHLLRPSSFLPWVSESSVTVFEQRCMHTWC